MINRCTVERSVQAGCEATSSNFPKRVAEDFSRSERRPQVRGIEDAGTDVDIENSPSDVLPKTLQHVSAAANDLLRGFAKSVVVCGMQPDVPGDVLWTVPALKGLGFDSLP